MRPLTLTAIALLCLVAAAPASAQTQIAGGSNLLSQSHADQLGTWLGEGPIKISRIFTKSTGGASSVAFHAAADGQGRTFSVWSATGSFGTHLVGGYNPQSWNISGNYNLNPTNAGRTAFIFDLTSGVRRSQDLVDADNGNFQTLNDPSFGPTFGGGFDLSSDRFLAAGYSNGYSYNGVTGAGTNNLFALNGATHYTIGELETFTIGPADASSSAVPEPASLALILPGLLAMSTLRRRRLNA